MSWSLRAVRLALRPLVTLLQTFPNQVGGSDAILLDLAIDHMGASYLLGRHRGIGLGRFFASLEAILEILDCAAEILADVAQLFGAENQHHHEKNDQPMPNRKGTHKTALQKN
jgi:hypothetical protein